MIMNEICMIIYGSLYVERYLYYWERYGMIDYEQNMYNYEHQSNL